MSRKIIFVSHRAAPLLGEYFGDGAEIRPLPPSPRLPAATADHGDMLLFPAGSRLFVPAYYYEENKALFDGINVTPAAEMHGDKYPADVLMNAFILKGCLYGRIDTIAGVILSYAAEKGIRPVPVRQGYTKCSTALLPDAAVTADAGICHALRENDTEALLIPPGHIELPGYDYGFIGGASFYMDSSLYFFGKIEAHPAYRQIKEFCARRGVTPVSLGNGPLCDYGGALVLRRQKKGNLCAEKK